MIKCSECGYENMDGLDYCDGCGAKLETAAAQGAGVSGVPSAAASSSTPPVVTPQPAGAKETAAVALRASAGEVGNAAAGSRVRRSTDPSTSNEHVAVVPEPPLPRLRLAR